MTTLREVKRLVQPLLVRNPDLVLVDRLVVLTPIDHLVRGIHIGRTSSANLASIVWAAIPPFKPAERFYVNFGDDLIAEPPAWVLTRPELPETLVKIAERDALPKLRAITSIADFDAFLLSPELKGRPLGGIELRRVYIDAALGKFASALEHLAIVRDHPEFFREITITPEHYDALVTVFGPRLEARNRTGVASMLNEWEAYTIGQMKLTHLWRPSPFPVELQV